MTEPVTVTMLGLPAAGKTTYAVAFYVACEAAQDGMSITDYAYGNRRYLNKLADDLAECKQLERTSQKEQGELRLRMKLAADQPEHELVMPDLSGELLRDSMSDRRLHDQLFDLIDHSKAVLLFVRTDRLIEPTPLADFNAALQAAAEEAPSEEVQVTPEQWTIGLAASQARLTDLVQELIRLRVGRLLRLGLVLSAWDTQASGDLKPGEWARERLPLLVQLLDNHSQVDWEVFGVSAQGGCFAGPEKERLRKTRLQDRPEAQRSSGEPASIGAPLRWALAPP